MTSKLKTDVLETVSGSGTIALTNQLSGMTHESMPSGSVVQVVQNYTAYSSAVSTTTTNTWLASGIIASITPKYIGSKILVNWTNTMSNSSDWGKANMYVYDGGWSGMAGAGSYHIGYTETAKNNYAPYAFNGNFVTTDLNVLSFQPFFYCGGGLYTFLHNQSSYALTLTEIKQ